MIWFDLVLLGFDDPALCVMSCNDLWCELGVEGLGKMMSSGDLEGEWRAASYFLAKGPSATLQFLAEGARAHLFALKTQALDGNCPPGQDGSLATDPSLRKRQVCSISQATSAHLIFQHFEHESFVCNERFCKVGSPFSSAYANKNLRMQISILHICPSYYLSCQCPHGYI